MSLVDDPVFLAKLTDADAECVTATLVHFRPLLVRLVSRRLPPSLRARLDAEDVVQEALWSFALRVQSREYRFDRLAHVEHLLSTIAVTKLRERIREHHAACRDVSREEAVQNGRAPPAGIREPFDPAGDSLRAAIAADLLAKVLQGLPDWHQEIIRFYVVDAYTVEEISYMVVHSVPVVSQVLRDAQQRLIDLNREND
jgi:RNA polymerase sigma factor (sigma-70 family)